MSESSSAWLIDEESGVCWPLSEADACVAGLRRDSEAGVFFASSSYYAYVVRRD